jgi:hypothetical protein
MPMTRTADGRVQIDMSEDDFAMLLMALGVATAAGISTPSDILALVNRMNEGNPDWRPYDVG